MRIWSISTASAARHASTNVDAHVFSNAIRSAEQYQQQQAEAQAQAAPAPPPPEDDESAQLTKLAQLHSQGILSDEEFTAAKAKILGI